MESLKKIIWEYFSSRETLDSIDGIVDITFEGITGDDKIQEFQKLPKVLQQKIIDAQLEDYKPIDYWNVSESV